MNSAVTMQPVSTEQKRAFLAERLRKAAREPAPVPLSFAQERLWFLDQLEPNSSLYNIPTVARLSGRLEFAALENALEATAARHEILRTRIVCLDEEPMQVVDPEAAIGLKLIDLSRETIDAVQRAIRGEVNRPFDLARDRLLRATLLRLGAEEHILIVVMHHIVSDEWSLKIFFNELKAFYEAAVDGREQPMPDLAIQYGDYSVWQREWLVGDLYERQLKFWKSELEGVTAITEFLTDRPRGALPTFRGATRMRDLGQELSDAIKEIARRYEATLFMVLLAAFKTLVHRYTGQQDLIVGSPIAGRNRQETEGLIGFFVNTLVLRTRISGRETFLDLLGQVRERTLGACAHQDLPFERLVAELHPERSLSHLPFTRVMFALQNGVLETMDFAEVTAQFMEVESEAAKFDVTFAVQDTSRGLVARVEYNSDLFEGDSIGRLLEHFEVLLRGIAANPNQRLCALPLINEGERKQLLVDWNQTRVDYPRDQSIPALFEAQAKLTPQASAVVFGDECLTYRELNIRANQLAHYLTRHGVGPEVPVGICMERSCSLVVGVLACLKAGGFYVPLDPKYPKDRLAFMLTDTQGPVLLTQQRLLAMLPGNDAEIVCLDTDWERIAGESREDPAPRASAENLAYVMYTSGSTGQPKGVAVPHRAITRLVRNTNYIELTDQDRIAQVSNVSFDAATFEIWGALLNGGELVGITREVALSPADFARELREKRITAMFLTAALFNQLASEAPGAFEGIRTVIAGGEALDPKWVRAVLDDRPPQRLVNGYGPTENTTFSCCHLIEAVPTGATNIPIGRPISNTQAYVLDAALNPVPIGVPGELYVGGDGLARGYWRRPELTTERFIPNPFSQGDYLYKTGDLVRYRPDGRIEFLGRSDEQVKIRGFRIELGEIETVLGQHPGVQECTVTASGNGTGHKRLMAYFVPKGKRAVNASALLGFLKTKLPEYMIPALFVPLNALPLTPNGKVDRNALPAANKVRPELERKYAAPRDEVEVELTQIWEKVLDLRPIGIEDKFFDLGGHSLLATRVIAQIEKRFGKRLRLATIFQAPTIEELAAVIREEIKEGNITTGTSLVEIQSKGSKTPLFLVHGAGGGMFWGYVNLSRHLGREQPVYGFKSRGLDGIEEFESLEQMAAHYVADLRVIQPHGPYHLGGYCFGGNVAFEMARQLCAQGEEVAVLTLMNCAPPNSAYTRIPWTPRWFARLLKNLGYWADHFRHWTPSQRREFFRWKLTMLKKRIGTDLRKSQGLRAPMLEAEKSVDLSSFSAEQRKLWDAHIRAQQRYQPKPFPGRVRLFRSPGHPFWCSFDPGYGWGEFALGGVTVTVVPGAHEKILEEPCVGFLAAELQKLLTTSEESSSREDFTSARKRPTADTSLHFWKQKLAAAPALLELPTDFARPPAQSCRVTRQRLAVSPQVAVSLKGLGAARQKLGDVALAGVMLLLKRYSRQEDMVVGIEIPRPDAGPVPHFANGLPNFLPLRLNLSVDCTAEELISNVEAERKKILEHGDLPFAKLVEELRLASDPSYHPVFQIRFRSEAERSSPQETDRPQIGELTPEPTKFDLTFSLVSKPDTLELQIDQATDLFKPKTIGRMLRHWEILLQAIATRPQEKLSRLPLLTPDEIRQLEQWNETWKTYPRDKSLVELFDEQVAQRPNREALVCGNTRLTYRQLDAQASRVANRLRVLGAGKQALVGICLERSWEMIAGILGTLRAGAAYVPMDPAYPKDRLAFMMEDANLSVLLTQEKLVHSLTKTNARVLCVEEVLGEVSDEFEALAASRGWELPASTDLAYVIYTSGSTGKPKGVALEHRSAVAFVSWARDVFLAGELEGVLASTSICFDLSIFEMFVPLCCGGKVILAENALALPTIPAANEVVLINTVPSAIRELVRLKGVPKSVRVVNLAGEPLPTPLVDQIYNGTGVQKVYDLYGPTETTTYSTFTLRKPGEPATIGRPLANEQVYILDPHQNLQPIGVPGELYIGGDGLAREYLNRPDLTAEKFVANPFEQGSRLYRTGDLARWREDGNLEFLGRIDHQVKVRGFRIELGEIETALKKHPAVENAVVMVREDQPGDRRLAAYVVGRGAQVPAMEELRRALKEKLPDYMLPSAFVWLDELPLTPNGKIDRKALPAPGYDRGASAGELVAPRNATETQVAAIWSEVLQIREVSVRDNFFDLGGHSLLAIQVVSRIREIFNVDFPLSGLFDAPTVAALSEGLAAGRWNPLRRDRVPLVRISRAEPLPASFVQERLWFLDQLTPGGHAYNVPLALRLKGKLDVTAFEEALNAVVRRHEALRTRFEYKDGRLLQVISADLTVALPVIDISDSANREQAACDLVDAEAQKPFDLAKGPLVRARLVRLGAEDHALVIVMHHTVSDGWSQSILLKEVCARYEVATHGTALPGGPDLALQYADFAAWQRRSWEGKDRERELHFWKEKLAGAPSALDLPLDRFPEADGLRPAGRCGVLLSPAGQASPPVSREGLTPFMVLVAAVGRTLHLWTGQNDLVIGTVTAGRNRRETEDVIGCFMNFLPIRVKLSDEETVRQFLTRTKAAVLEMQEHQDCPFEKIVEAINPERRQDQNPLYNVGLLLQNFPAEAFHGGALQAQMMPVTMAAALLDLRFEALESPEGLLLECEYRTDLFERSTAEVLLASVREIFERISSHPEVRMADLKIKADLAAQARIALTKGSRQTIAIAATFTGEPVQEPLEYWIRELSWQAKVEFAPFNQVFQQLFDSGSLLGSNERGLNVVLVRLEDWLPSVAVGNCEAGLAAIEQPLRDFVQAARGMAARSPVPCLVCLCPESKAASERPELVECLRSAETRLTQELENVAGLYIFTNSELARLYPVECVHDESADELGKVPYTPEFFTGLGTLIVRKLHALDRPPYKVIVLDCDQTLWSGVCAEDGAKGIRLDPERLALQKFMRAQHDAGMLLCLCSKNNEEDVHAVFHQRLEMPLRREHLAASRLNWLPKSENLKSLADELQLGLDSFIFIDDNPLECAEVEANCPEVLTLQLPEDRKEIPQFLQHCWAFDHLKVTSEDRQRAETYRQNQQREQLRADSMSLADFLAGLDLRIRIEPMAPEELSRVAQLTQRTNQFNCTTRRRTEGELQQLLGISEILSVSVTDRFGDYGLVGVVIFEAKNGALDVDTFLLSCRVLGRGVEHRMLSQLGAMGLERGLSRVDVHFTPSSRNQPASDFLERVGVSFKQPLNGGYTFCFPAEVASRTTFNPPNSGSESAVGAPRERQAPHATRGDSRKFSQCREIALRLNSAGNIQHRIEAKASVASGSAANYVPPQTERERELCEVWRKLLRVERVGIRDNFFELGGHSLLAVRLFAEMERLSGRKLPLVTLFQAPTIEQLAKLFSPGKASASLLVPIQPKGARPPLFLVHGAGGDVLWGYANLASRMPADQPIYGIKSRGQAGLEEFSRLEEMAACYLQEVRAFQSKGPYYFGGYCFGGNVAYEMARQLTAQGEQVALVCLLDTTPANAGYETAAWWRPRFSYRFIRNFYWWLKDFAALSPAECRSFIARKLRALGRRAMRWLGRKEGPESVDLEAIIDASHFPAHELKLWQAHLDALAGHIQEPYDGPVTLLRTRGQALFCSLEEDFCWHKLVPRGVKVRFVPGSHESVFVEPNVGELAKQLAKCIEEAVVDPARTTATRGQTTMLIG